MEASTQPSPVLHVVLYQPEIPPNTGNVIRLCANTGAKLHLIGPLGFELDDRRLRRAGLDYREWAQIQSHASFADFRNNCRPQRLFACSSRGATCYSGACHRSGDFLLFGPETRGLPDDVLQSVPVHCRIRIPMVPRSRSLNLSNAVAVVLYEAWRQLRYPGA